MGKLDILRKLGVMRSGAVAGTYKNAKERPTELMMDGVYNAEKDLVNGKSQSKKSASKPAASSQSSNTDNQPSPSNKNDKGGNNPLALWGLIVAFFVPLVGLILSIAGLVKAKQPEVGKKGLAIGGIIVSLIVGFIQMIGFIVILAAIFSSSSLTLTEYRDPTHGYTVQHPKDWTKETELNNGAESVYFRDKVGNSGKVTGQVEVVYVAKPAAGGEYKENFLQIFKNELVKQNQNTTVEYSSEQTFKGNPSLRMIATYDGENGRIKSKTTLLKNSKDEILAVSTQSPIENYDKYSEKFDEIHATFNP